MKTAILLVMLALVVADAAVIYVRNGKEKSTGLERSIPCPTGAQCYSGNCGVVMSFGGHALCCCGGSDMTVHGNLNLGSPTWYQVPCTCSY
ncbi:Hypp2749 [Branchiostoma lanceolatum]|uniref:Hypp2749 protein n=1 Tax=Branchiostoma lanceolatum TaxID=7740 RepID=A0A8J9ZUA2_BRALA|nr:Hypp2749 [Branchiostoma lanceolatum]CAH1263708.1 Hypp2749 [Branchiostoma lanceolatum]